MITLRPVDWGGGGIAPASLPPRHTNDQVLPLAEFTRGLAMHEGDL